MIEKLINKISKVNVLAEDRGLAVLEIKTTMLAPIYRFIRWNGQCWELVLETVDRDDALWHAESAWNAQSWDSAAWGF